MLMVEGGTTGVTPPAAFTVPIGDSVKPKAIEVNLDFNLLIMFVNPSTLFRVIPSVVEG